MKKLYFILFLGIVSVSQIFAQNNPAPAKAQTRPIVLTNATIHIGNGQVLTNASIRFEQGIITAVGTEVDKSGAEEINVEGQHIYPSIILPATQLGLIEVGAVRPTRDAQEANTINPHARALIAYNTDSELIPTTRSNGILLVETTPEGGAVSGMSSVMNLDGWNWEDAVLTPDIGIHANWIPMYTRAGFASPNPGRLEKNERRTEQLQELDLFFKEAYAYAQSTNPTAKNLIFEAMKGLFDGTKILFIHVNFGREIVESVQFAQQHQVKKIVIVGGNQALDVADFLRDNNIPVILNGTHRTPSRADEDVWLPYKQPYLLKQKGVLVGMAYNEEAHRARNLPFLAGTASAYGLTKEEALMMITANNAKILGIDSKVGTLEKGKQATLVVSSGDLLDMRTNNVTYAFIQGRKLDLDDKHKQLYRRFKEKYGN